MRTISDSVDRSRFTVRSIHFQSLDMFGHGKVGFIKFKCDVVDANGKFLPGIIFARGGSVAILTVLACEGEDYAVLTVQPRLATGSFEFAEICAGMLDGEGNFAGVAAKEMKEELGIEIKESDLCDLTELAGFKRGAFPSPGGCEETIRIFVYRRQVSRPELEVINGRCTGLLAEGEQITLKSVRLDDLLLIPDMKTIVAYALYQRYRGQIDVAPPPTVPANKEGC